MPEHSCVVDDFSSGSSRWQWKEKRVFEWNTGQNTNVDLFTAHQHHLHTKPTNSGDGNCPCNCFFCKSQCFHVLKWIKRVVQPSFCYNIMYKYPTLFFSCLFAINPRPFWTSLVPIHTLFSFSKTIIYTNTLFYFFLFNWIHSTYNLSLT